MKHVTYKATICAVCNNYFVIRSMLCLLILLCFVETKYLQCCCISKTWLYIFISNRYTLCSEHGNIETKYLQCNAAAFLRHDYIYSHFLPSSVASVDSSEGNILDINCSSNSTMPWAQLTWHWIKLWSSTFMAPFHGLIFWCIATRYIFFRFTIFCSCTIRQLLCI